MPSTNSSNHNHHNYCNPHKNPHDHPNFERQIALEAEMISRGTLAYRKATADAKANGIEAATPSGSHLIKRAIKPVADAIRDFLKTTASGKAGRKHVAAQYLRDISPDMAAFLALRTCLNMISGQVTLQNAANTIGNSLETEARLTAFEEANIDEYRKISSRVSYVTNEQHKRAVYLGVARKNDVDLPTWPMKDKVLLGQKLIELIADTTGYIEIITDRKSTSAKRSDVNGAFTYHVIGSAKCLDWMAKMEEYTELATPEYMPTIMPPKPWTCPTGGGYYSTFKLLKLVKTGKPNYVEELALMTDEMPVLYEAINAMQDTGYAINRNVLDVMKTLWEAGGDVAGIPARENYQVPRCPFCGAEIPHGKLRERGDKHPCFTLPENKDALKDWKRHAAAIYDKNVITLSRRFQFAKTLYLAGRFQDEAAIYFPMQLDFRGRCYAVPSFLNPQGADAAKGLLLFSEAKPVETEEARLWLAVQGANVWGNDKVSLEERLAWVLEQEAAIIAIAESPYDNRMWFDADRPWQFLAFCFEWAAYRHTEATGGVFFSRLPVAMDGTCNGLQIFSLMLRDPIGGMATNLLPTERPQDIYQIVADKTTEKLKEKLVSGGIVMRKDTEDFWYDEKDMAGRLLTLGITRKTTKRQVMVLPYGGTFISCGDYTREHLLERIEADEDAAMLAGITKENAFAAGLFLAPLIWDAIGQTVVAAREAMTFLQKLATVASSAELPVNWITPVGFLVSQAYLNLKEYRIETKLGASIVRLTIKEDGEALSIDRRRQRNGISPNFVHSLDAAAMCSSISLARSEGVSSFMMIHDSYGTHAADAAVFAHCLRTAFVRMFTERDVLQELKDAVAAMLPPEKIPLLPEIPEAGNLDITKVLQSAFFFA